jgi:hypothetical protein
MTRAAIAIAFLLTACSSDDNTDSGPPPPAPETLFETLPAASPEKLRGVWQSTQTQPDGTVELRVRFTDKYLVGAAKCLAKGSDTPVVAGGSIGLETTALDAATGKVTFGTLGVLKEEGGLRCEASLPGNTYDFRIEGSSLSFSVGNAKLNLALTKIGD